VWGRDECRGSWAVSHGTETQGTRTLIPKENFQNSQKIIESNNLSEKTNFSKIENLKNVTLHENFDQDLYCFQVTECVVRPDIELKKLMACAMRVGEVRH
jgi:predicted DNA binding CopG/RHH family protein